MKAEVRVATSNAAKFGVVVPMPITPLGPIVREPMVEVPLVPVTVIVPVAMRLAADRVPENKPLPWTDSKELGVVVPIPNLPLEPNIKRFVLSEVWIWKKLDVWVPAPRRVRATDWEEVASIKAVEEKNEKAFGEVVAGVEVPMKRPPKMELWEVVAEMPSEPFDNMPPEPTMSPSIMDA